MKLVKKITKMPLRQNPTSETKMVKISIVDWAKYNPRTDIKTMSWFRMEVTIGSDRRLFALRPNQKWGWIMLLSQCGIDNSGNIDIDLDFLCHSCECDRHEILHLLETLQRYKMVTYEIESDDTPELDYTSGHSEVYVRTHQGIRPGAPGVDEKRVLTNERTNERTVRTNKDIVRTSPPQDDIQQNDDSQLEKQKTAAPKGAIPNGTHLQNGISNSLKKSDQPKRTLRYSESQLDLGTRWLDWAKTQKPGHRLHASWTPEHFADGIRKVMKKAGLTDRDMEFAFAFIQSSDFWSTNAQSPRNLDQRSKNGNMKIENILLSMRNDPNYKTEKAIHDFAYGEPDNDDANNPLL